MSICSYLSDLLLENAHHEVRIRVVPDSNTRHLLLFAAEVHTTRGHLVYWTVSKCNFLPFFLPDPAAFSALLSWASAAGRGGWRSLRTQSPTTPSPSLLTGHGLTGAVRLQPGAVASSLSLLHPGVTVSHYSNVGSQIKLKHSKEL